MSEENTSKGSTNQEETEGVVNKNLQKGTEGVVDALSDNKGGDWKKALSGALDEERLLCALVVLCIFYIGQTLGNAYHDNNKKDEDKIVETCGCKPEHRAFYISWSVICYILWFLCHSVVLFHNNQMLFKRCFCIRKTEDKQNRKLKCCCCTYRTQGKINITNRDDDMQKTDNCSWIDKQCKTIDHCKYHLWTQYYELYVIGITKNSEKVELNQVLDKIINEASKNIPGDNKQTINKNQTRTHGRNINEPMEDNIIPEKNEGEDERHKIITGEQKINSGDNAKLLENMEGDGNINQATTTLTSQAEITTALPRQRHTDQPLYIQRLFYYILSFIRYIAQLAVVPLLMIQILDTYAYLCFTANSYCTMSSQYKLHLDQTAMTFAFYCSLMISLLSSTMLRWFPLPAKNSESLKTESAEIPTSTI